MSGDVPASGFRDTIVNGATDIYNGAMDFAGSIERESPQAYHTAIWGGVLFAGLAIFTQGFSIGTLLSSLVTGLLLGGAVHLFSTASEGASRDPASPRALATTTRRTPENQLEEFKKRQPSLTREDYVRDSSYDVVYVRNISGADIAVLASLNPDDPITPASRLSLGELSPLNPIVKTEREGISAVLLKDADAARVMSGR